MMMEKSTKQLAKELGLLRKRPLSFISPRCVKKKQRNAQQFSYLIVIDFESTCWENDKLIPQEIIEFPAVLLNTSTGQVEDEFHHYLQPSEQPTLSNFCKQLTGISQDTVDNGIPLSICLRRFATWLRKLKENKGIVCADERSKTDSSAAGVKLAALVTWSDWDLGVCLLYEARRKQLTRPVALNCWIDLRATYKKFYSRRPEGLNGALKELGIEFDGREHSGLDDAKNTTRLAWRMMCDSCVMAITKTLKMDKQGFVERTSIPPSTQASAGKRSMSANLSMLSGTKRSSLPFVIAEDKCETSVSAPNLNKLNCEHVVLSERNQNVYTNQSNNTCFSKLKNVKANTVELVSIPRTGECENIALLESSSRMDCANAKIHDSSCMASVSKGQDPKKMSPESTKKQLPGVSAHNPKSDKFLAASDPMPFTNTLLTEEASTVNFEIIKKPNNATALTNKSPSTNSLHISNIPISLPKQSSMKSTPCPKSLDRPLPKKLSPETSSIASGVFKTPSTMALVSQPCSTPHLPPRNMEPSRLPLKTHFNTGNKPLSALTATSFKCQGPNLSFIKSSNAALQDSFGLPVTDCTKTHTESAMPPGKASLKPPISSTLTSNLESSIAASSNISSTASVHSSSSLVCSTYLSTVHPCTLSVRSSSSSSSDLRCNCNNVKQFKTPSPTIIVPSAVQRTVEPFKTPNTTNIPAKSSMRVTPPLCQCGRRSRRRQVQKYGPNMGRLFFTCSMGRPSGTGEGKHGCGFFQWESPGEDMGCQSSRSNPAQNSVTAHFNVSSRRSLGIRSNSIII